MGDTAAAPSHQQIARLVGVYDADGTVRGEVAYWVGARLGKRHCALCDITHGAVGRKSGWTTCQEGLSVPFDTYHRNDQPDPVRTATGSIAPVVVAQTSSNIIVLLGPTELDACAGSIDQLVAAIEQAVERLGLTWPSPS